MIRFTPATLKTCIAISAYIIHVVMSSGMYSLTNGATTISQECIPRRQRQVDVTEISIVCDYQASEDNDDATSQRFSYSNKPTCLSGDLGKVAIACKCFVLDDQDACLSPL